MTNNTSPKFNGLVALLLALTLLAGGYYRFVGLNWDDFTHLHPDERFLTQVLAAVGGDLRIEDPVRMAECMERYPNDNGRGLYLNGGYFDSQCSALNPNNVGFGLYVYGTLPLFIADMASDRYADARLAIAEWNAQRQGIEPPPFWEFDLWRGYNGAHLVWRALNGASDLLAAFFLFLIGRRLHNKWTGLLAAVLYVAAPLPIQKAHFATVNSMANLFGVLALYFAVRAQDNGGWGDYFGFGVAFAAALASRINLVPLVVLILFAAGLRMLPVFDWRLAWGERRHLIVQNFGGLVLAGIVTIVGFRIFQPYAFIGPGPFSVDWAALLGAQPSLTGEHSFGIFNPEWLANVGQAQYLVSGAAESPPNWQWVNRTGYLFPFTNMVLWGMGLAAGLAAWLGWLWALVRIVRTQQGATRNLLPVAWIGIYFLWIGNLWVMSMRYYLPLYPGLILLGAWALVTLVQRANVHTGRLRPVWRYGAALLVVGVVGFTHLWALMFTNIYRSQLTRVQASHYVWEQIHGDFAMRIDGAPEGTPLVNVGVFNRGGEKNVLDTQASLLGGNTLNTFSFITHADGTISEIMIPHMGASVDDPEPETVRFSILTPDAIEPETLAEGELTANLTRANHVIGDSYTVALDPPLAVTAGDEYVLRVDIDPFEEVLVSGAVVSHEGPWDDPVPTIVCTMPDGITLASDPPPGLNTALDCNGRNAYGGLVNGYSLEMSLDDIELKRENMKLVLDNTDYIVISSNRFYDTQSRNPGRWPMTMAYYEALFNGELGFELEAVFQETFELGPLRVSDQHLPFHDTPAWWNEFEAEEAFHVYDHPVVMIYRKTDAYTSENMQRILDSVPLNRADDVMIGLFNSPDLIGVNPLYSLPADETPTQLKLKPEERELQYANGTWSERFFSSSLINTNPVIAVVAWWGVMLLLGTAAFPLAFVLFPMLHDRGYAASKFLGLFLVAWFAWFATSLKWRLWDMGGVWLVVLLLALLSAALVWRHRAEFAAYIRTEWRQILLLEAVMLVAFLFFLGVRLSNPDLWHPVFGGEKPMDFAYFNGVLRSTSFPPLDPWHAGGFINYYYFGFVMAGVPTLMLGMVPSIAYNLAIPTMFALTGMGAFTVAYNLVAGINTRQDDTAPRSLLRVTGSPWTAGMSALLLAVVLGNLNTPRVFMNGVASLGGFEPNTDMNTFLVEQYQDANGGAFPEGDDLTAILARAEDPGPLLEVQFALDDWFDSIGATFQGFGLMLQGEAPRIATNRWYWASTRILAEPPVSSGNAITEIPYFTFLYGDLHAHMISMPVQLFILLFLAHELFIAGRDRRRFIVRALAIASAAIAAGMLRATNTWDWPTYMLLGVLGLGFAWWLAWRNFSRDAFVSLFLRVGGFIALSIWLSWPYTTWYAAIYSSASLWQGPKSPIWAYLLIHGLFLFLGLSLLIWETGRWLASTRVRALRGRAAAMYAGLLLLALVLLASAILSVFEWRVTLIALPMIVWAGVLFFRPDQSREMQFTLVIFALALAVTLGVEYIVIDGDIGRQNTVFKFYLQGWLMFSVVGGAAVAWMLEDAFAWRPTVRGGWLAALGLLVATAALYPLMATQARAVDRMAPEIGLTLDGMDYMAAAQHYEVVDSAAGRGELLELAYDYNVIRWLQENVEGTPVIMEAQSEAEYRWGSRISIYTGLPSVVGWNWHQRQQRTFDPMPRMVQQRVANVNAFYTTTDTAEAANILQHYGVQYVIVSALENARYPEAGLAKLDEMANDGVLEVVYEDGIAKIYAVNQRAAQQLALGQLDDERTEVARGNE